jgi:hypothetical protein
VYVDLYDELHRYHVLSTFHERTKPRLQKGIRERLLCDACEQQLSGYERYALGIMKGGESVMVATTPVEIALQGIDYRRFKLFQLSILWRAGIASDSMFSRVKLGHHEERLRLFLRDSNPGKPTDYACIMFGITRNGKPLVDFIDQPTRLRIGGIVSYRFIFASVIWVFFVGSHSLSSHFGRYILSKEGEIIIPIQPYEALSYLEEFANDLHRSGRLPSPH